MVWFRLKGTMNVRNILHEVISKNLKAYTNQYYIFRWYTSANRMESPKHKKYSRYIDNMLRKQNN